MRQYVATDFDAALALHAAVGWTAYTPGQRSFYESLGYSSIEGTTLRAFTRFDS